MHGQSSGLDAELTASVGLCAKGLQQRYAQLQRFAVPHDTLNDLSQ